MKKYIFYLVFFLSAMILGAQSSGAAMFVAANTVNLRDSSGFFARVIGTLSLGEEVTVQQNHGRWLVVRNASGLQGWVSADALSTRRRVAQTGSNVSPAEFALAGKGFNSSLEEILRSSGDIDFSMVDAMENRRVSVEMLLAFLEEGRLTKGE